MPGSKIAIITLLILVCLFAGGDRAHAAGTKIAWGRDPFLLEEPKEEGSGPMAGFKLMGITVSKDGRPQAVINDKMVTKGSKMGKFKVLDVLSNKVILLDTEDDTQLELKL